MSDSNTLPKKPVMQLPMTRTRSEAIKSLMNTPQNRGKPMVVMPSTYRKVPVPFVSYPTY